MRANPTPVEASVRRPRFHIESQSGVPSAGPKMPASGQNKSGPAWCPARLRSLSRWNLFRCGGLLLGYGLGCGHLCSRVAGRLGFVLGHELALLGLAVVLVFHVIDLGAGIGPHHALGLGVDDRDRSEEHTS